MNRRTLGVRAPIGVFAIALGALLRAAGSRVDA